MPSKKFSEKQILEQVELYCARSEKCTQDVKLKLRKMQVPQQEQQQILEKLQRQGFIDEARFSRLFARDKFNLNGWGKIKITAALRQKSIPEKFIAAGLKEIEDEKYLQTLEKLAQRKTGKIPAEDDYAFRNKLAAHLISRGFEAELAWQVVQKIKKG